MVDFIELKNARHSVLIYIKEAKLSEQLKDNINKLLKNGVKVIIMTTALNCAGDIGLCYQEYEKIKLLQIYYGIQTCVNELETMYIVDGRRSEIQDQWLQNVSQGLNGFNYEQYQVEHAGLEENLCVEAGAGTGKTTVMIERIFFLLHMIDSLSPKDIVMITFTRDATQHMRHKLQHALLLRYKLTGKKRYLSCLEDIGMMRIHTIPAFAKHIMAEIGAIAGFGKNLKIRGYAHERKRIINQVLNNYLNQGRMPGLIQRLLKMPLYNFVDLCEGYWVQFENKGVSIRDIGRFDWGESEVRETQGLHEILMTIFQDIEEEFHKLKKRENAIALNDLTRELDIASEIVDSLSHKVEGFRYLFVDEFQDTDNTQIKLVAWIQRQLGIKLMVVGDIKQSIYRFRGANYTAFEELKQQLREVGVPITSIKLKKNYRTCKNVLENADKYFSIWGMKDFLSYTENDRLIPTNQGEGVYREIPNNHNSSKMIERYTIGAIQEVLEYFREQVKLKGKLEDSERIAAIVRTNFQAKTIRDWCEAAHIPCYVEVGGSFYASPAVRDFNVMLAALLFPEDTAHQINLLVSPYSIGLARWRPLWECNGNENLIMEIIESSCDWKRWQSYREAARLKPVFSVIREIMRELSPADMYYLMEQERLVKIWGDDKENIETEVKRNAIQYKKNLNHLMELLRRKFSDEFISLHTLHEFLSTQIATNRKEDEPRLDANELVGSVSCMTVHKSKGLEFDTVIIPFTNKEFWKDDKNEIILDQSDDGWKIGWKIVGDDITYMNSYYPDLVESEQVEIKREETRLLYVAMTRAIRNLIIVNSGNRQKTWSELLRV
jgi:DNA helicase-2/ATP-dependent DNA helicase PcrA